MHIAFNGYFWNRPNSGSGQYVRQLVFHLNQHVSDLKITLVFPQLKSEKQAPDVPGGVEIENVALRAGNFGKVWWEQIDFPRACRRVGADVAHVPYWGSPLRSPLPAVVTIHDIITLLTPEYHASIGMRLYNSLVSATARGAAHIITDSEFSRADIVKHLHVDAGIVTPIHLAVAESFTEQPNLLLDMAVQRKYDLPEEYVLYLGGFVLHKNVPALLLAYTYVVDALGDDYPLLLAGNKPNQVSTQFPDYDQYIDNLNIKDNVRWLGFVDEEDKPVIYKHASCFVFPSKYEGFGLPPLEAMACGTPVVTTTASSIPEVVGEAAFAVEADDERGLAGAIIATLIQDDLAAQLRQQGLTQAAKFSWQKTAIETLAVYDKVVASK